MASSPGEVMGSLDDGQAYKSEADCDQKSSSRVSAVLTCSGNLTDPDFNEKCNALFDRLQNVLCNDEINVVKCEPWNSVKITFDLPTEAAQRLSELAELARRGDDTTLRQLGILSLQVQGGQIISMTLADGPNNPSSASSSSSRTTYSTGNSRVESATFKSEDRDVPSAVASRLPSSTAISVVSSRTGGSSPHSYSPSSSSPSSSSSISSATSSSLKDRGSHIKRSSSGQLANSVNQRNNTKTNRSAGESSSNSSLLVNLLQKDTGNKEMDSSPPERKRRKYSSQGGSNDKDSPPFVTKVANAMMGSHHSANGPSGLSESERILAERLASAASAGTTLIPPRYEGTSSGKDRAKGSHNQYGTTQTDLGEASSSSKFSNKSVSLSRTGNRHLNTQIHSESSTNTVSEKKQLDANSASGGESLLNSMMPPPKSKSSSATGISTNLSNSMSSETNSLGSKLGPTDNTSDKQKRVQHPAIVGGVVSRDNKVNTQHLHNATDSLSNNRDQQISNRATMASKSRQVLNPSTGMLESGPSESSSEGEAEGEATSDKKKSGSVVSPVIGNSDGALKVKLRLPSAPQIQQQTNESSTLNNSANDISISNPVEQNSEVEPKQKKVEPALGSTSKNTSISERLGTVSDPKTKVIEPKLPKLILSMREKKVKLAQESAAASTKSQKVSPQTRSSLGRSSNRKKERKTSNSDEDASDSEDVEDDEGGEDYHPTDEEDDIDDEDIDEQEDEDDEEALKIATARVKNLRMMQLHASSSPSRNEDSSRDTKVQNRTSLSQNDEKHLKSLETSRSKFLRMKQQQRTKKQNMQLNQTPRVELWKDSLIGRETPINEINKLVDKDGNLSRLKTSEICEKSSKTLESHIDITSKRDSDILQQETGVYSSSSNLSQRKSLEISNVRNDLQLHSKLANNLGSHIDTSEECLSKNSSVFSSSELSKDPKIGEQKSNEKDHPSSSEDPMRNLLYSTSIVSAKSSSGSSTSSTSSGADKQDLSLDPQNEPNVSLNCERSDISDPISALSLPQRDIDSRDNHQQGEDSGIESMDTLSEKSPNQGDDAFPNQEKLDREIKDMTHISISSPSHNSATAASPPRIGTKISQSQLSKSNERSNANDNIGEQGDETDTVTPIKNVMDTSALPEEATTISSVKSESVQLPTNVEGKDIVNKNLNVKDSMEIQNISPSTIKTEEVLEKESSHIKLSDPNDKCEMESVEINIKPELSISIDKKECDAKSDEAASILSNADEKSVVSEAVVEDHNKNPEDDRNVNDNTIPSETLHSMQVSNETQNKNDDSIRGNTDHVRESNTSESLVKISQADHTYEVIKSESESAEKNHSNTNNDSLIPTPKSLSLDSQKEDTKPKKGDETGALESLKLPSVVLEKVPTPKHGLEQKVHLSNDSNQTSKSKSKIVADSNQSTVSVSLIKLPVSTETKNDIKMQDDKKIVEKIENKSVVVSNLSSVPGVSISSNNGLSVLSNGTIFSSNQEDSERSSSSTPEIPVLATTPELVNQSSGTNCITLHSAASAIGRTSSPILTNGATGGGIQVHRAAGLNNIPPGAKMVPVKLVSVPGGDGSMPGMRLVRVSPVKSHPSIHQGNQAGIAVDSNTIGSVPGTRTVVIKSSMLKSASSSVLPHATSHQTATVISTTPASNALSSTPIHHPHGASIIVSTMAMTPNPSPLPPHIVTSQPLSPSLLVNAVQHSINATPPSCVLKDVKAKISTPSPTPLVSNLVEHVSSGPYSISNHTNSSTTVELIPNSNISAISPIVNPANMPISVSIGRRPMAASVVPVPAMNTISSVAASSSGVTTLLGPSLSITPVEVANTGQTPSNSTKPKLIVEPSKPPAAILNSVLASMSATATRNPEPTPMIITGITRNQVTGTTLLEKPILVKNLSDVSSTVQTQAAVTTMSAKPKITEALKIDTKVKGINSRGRATKSPQRHHSNGDDFSSGGSLLRPLLQKEETLPATVITSHVEIESSVNSATATTQKGRKRRRHDTGSSTKSDKSDNSVIESMPTVAKKTKATNIDNKKSQQQNSSTSPAALSPALATATKTKGSRASRGKKEDVHSKDAEKNNGLPANEPVKVGIQTPAKKNARGASNSSTESLTKGHTVGKSAKSNAGSNNSSKGSSPASSASPSPSRTRKSALEDGSNEQGNKNNANQDTLTNAKERRSARQHTAALAAAADKTPAANASLTTASSGKTVKMESNDSKAVAPNTSTNSSTATKVLSTRPRRGVEDNSNNSAQNNLTITPGVSPASTRTRKTADEATNQATNGKVAAGRTTRNKPSVTDISSTSLDSSTSGSSSLSGANGNNNGVNAGSNGGGLSGNKDENTAGGAGKTAAPSEEQRTMKTRSAK